MPIVKPRLIDSSKFLITAEKERKTKFKQDKKTGLMLGRSSSSNIQGDGTRNIRFKQDIDINRDGKIDDRDVRGGQIGGRIAAGERKPEKIEVVNHYRKGKFVGHHFRKIH